MDKAQHISFVPSGQCETTRRDTAGMKFTRCQILQRLLLSVVNYGAADSPPEIDPNAPQTPNSLGPLVTCFGVVIPDVTQLIVS
ncbi:MAG: hypothetical protein LBC20_09500, partial [Planctomycetaceae bacterium]|nr:hypothetical protein [Planctomycetaceae bacterium]